MRGFAGTGRSRSRAMLEKGQLAEPLPTPIVVKTVSFPIGIQMADRLPNKDTVFRSPRLLDQRPMPLALKSNGT